MGLKQDLKDLKAATKDAQPSEMRLLAQQLRAGADALDEAAGQAEDSGDDAAGKSAAKGLAGDYDGAGRRRRDGTAGGALKSADKLDDEYDGMGRRRRS